MCSDCEAYGLKNHGLSRSDYLIPTIAAVFYVYCVCILYLSICLHVDGAIPVGGRAFTVFVYQLCRSCPKGQKGIRDR